MDEIATSQVALLIDFENLVRGASEDDAVDCEVLFRLAEEYGRVLLANAYADWRMKDVNQYQTDLYRLGVELVHVFGKGWGSGFKNAVDVKMAVDAIGAVSSLPHIDTFVIVSGDRDFLHVLKALRRHGKTVVGVSPASSASDDFAALCDRFVRYEALAATYENRPATSSEDSFRGDLPELTAVRQALASLVDEHPEGIKGAMIKPALRRKLSPSFDESAYGFSRLADLLYSLSDVAQVVVPEGGSDILVLPAATTATDHSSMSSPIPMPEQMIREARLAFYRFERDPLRRRQILSRLFDAMCERQPFKWEDIQSRMLMETAEAEVPLTTTILSRYKTMIFQSRGFQFEANQHSLPQRERMTRLHPDLQTHDDLVRFYETGVAYKIAEALGGDRPLTSEGLADVLGLDVNSTEELEYCRELIEGSAAMAPEEPEPG